MKSTGGSHEEYLGESWRILGECNGVLKGEFPGKGVLRSQGFFGG